VIVADGAPTPKTMYSRASDNVPTGSKKVIASTPEKVKKYSYPDDLPRGESGGGRGFGLKDRSYQWLRHV